MLPAHSLAEINSMMRDLHAFVSLRLHPASPASPFELGPVSMLWKIVIVYPGFSGGGILNGHRFKAGAFG